MADFLALTFVDPFVFKFTIGHFLFYKRTFQTNGLQLLINEQRLFNVNIYLVQCRHCYNVKHVYCIARLLNPCKMPNETANVSKECQNNKYYCNIGLLFPVGYGLYLCFIGVVELGIFLSVHMLKWQ